MRQARPSDAPAVAALLRQAAETGFSLQAVEEIDEARIAEDLAEGLGLRTVVERNGEVVGFLTIVPGETSRLRRTGSLQLVVRRDLQGKGIGAELMRHAVAWAEAGALDRIEIYLRETNTRALGLYRRFGFQDEGRLRLRIRGADGRRLDDLVLGRVFERPGEKLQ